MEFDLNTYSAQKALYDEASSFDHFFDDMFEDCDDWRISFLKRCDIIPLSAPC